MDTLANSAAKLAAQGFKIFPCKPRDKTPAVKWKAAATSDLETVRGWWQGGPELNVAIVTGAASGVFVLDVDGHEGDASLAKLEAAHGLLPDTVTSATARGRHLYFRMPPQPIPNSAGLVGPHLDIRANGDYVIAPPSVHPSGHVYAWSPSLDHHDMADAPEWLLELLLAKRKRNDDGALPQQVWGELMLADILEGQRNHMLARITGKLMSSPFNDPGMVRGLMHSHNEARCKPPLEADEVDRIVASVWFREMQRR